MTNSVDIPTKNAHGAKVELFSTTSSFSPRPGSGRFVNEIPTHNIPSFTTMCAAATQQGRPQGVHYNLVEEDEAEECDDEGRSRTFQSVPHMWSPCLASMSNSSGGGLGFLTPPQSSFEVTAWCRSYFTKHILRLFDCYAITVSGSLSISEAQQFPGGVATTGRDAAENLLAQHSNHRLLRLGPSEAAPRVQHPFPLQRAQLSRSLHPVRRGHRVGNHLQ